MGISLGSNFISSGSQILANTIDETKLTVAVGAAGTVLQSNGVGAAPSYATLATALGNFSYISHVETPIVFTRSTGVQYEDIALNRATPQTTESFVNQSCSGVNGTIKKIWVYISANGITGAGNTTMALRINGVDTSAVIAFASGVTGYQEATGITTVIADSDLINWRLTPGGTGGTTCSVTASGFTIAYTNVT